jgi:methionyl-tRNA synthetase
MEKFYITTPIFYPTGLPHIGTAYNVFIADTLARYYRKKLGKDNVFFLTGTDEHGANIAKKATDENIDPQTYVDRYAEEYKKIWKELGISNDYFIRTTNPNHEKFTQELIQKSFDNGDIYEGEYEGWYCQSCEAYYTESDLVDGKCPNHPITVPIFTKEKNYYFRLSKYQSWLLKYLEENKDFVYPQKWANYVKGLVEAGLQDIPVTRANVKWGVQVPFDKEQTIYVWYDALPNYLSIFDFPEFKGKSDFWNVAHHLVGKDIIKFHAILWPAMLKSAGYEPPKQVIVHGFFTVNGQKIGKSNNNAINPLELAQKYPVDAIRYALLTEFQLGNDGDFSFERLQSLYTSNLANNFGNLLNRVIHLSNLKEVEINNVEEVSTDFKKHIIEVKEKAEKYFDQYEIKLACDEINALAEWGNKYIQDNAPWSLTDKSEVQKVLNNLSYLLSVVIDLYEPILPNSCEVAKSSLAKRESVILFKKLD